METAKRIREILAEELEVSQDELSEDRLLSELDMDSLTLIQLLTDFQEEFGIDISIHELNQHQDSSKIQTVGGLIQLIEEEIQKPS